MHKDHLRWLIKASKRAARDFERQMEPDPAHVVIRKSREPLLKAQVLAKSGWKK